MFERFTGPARQAVSLAQVEARGLRHGYIGTEHLLLGVLGQPQAPGARALEGLGITLEVFRADVVKEVGEGLVAGGPDGDREGDQEALRTLGIDLEEVRRRVEEAFGPGALDHPVRDRMGRRIRGRHPRGRGRCESNPEAVGGRIPFTPTAKKILELSLREAIRLGHGHIGTEHIVLGIVREGEGLAAQLLAARGASMARIREAVDAELGRDSPGRSA
jgi:ATP-dependent Clp protease ATP-binding subunit ClpA